MSASVASAPHGAGWVVSQLRARLPSLLFGVRLWVSVCLALYIAFWLELDDPSWAATTAAVVCQPVLGASLRKGWFRMIGTVIGAVAAVVLSGLFPQSRAGFLIALALWCGACGTAARLLRNFAAYAATLAGFTCVLIAADDLGAVGGLGGNAFNLALARASEICLGIACAGFVLATTDRGGARRQLAVRISQLTAQAAGGLAEALRRAGPAQAESRLARRGLVMQVSGLDTVIDQTRGESAGQRFHPRTMRAATDGLLAMLSAWRTIALHLERTPEAAGACEAIRRLLPEPVRAATQNPSAAHVTRWATRAEALRPACLLSARALLRLPEETPSLRLLADRAAEGMIGLYHALGGLTVLSNPSLPDRSPRSAWPRVPDPLPPLVNCVRVTATVIAAELFWVVTGWPGGVFAVLFGAISVLFFSAQEDVAPVAVHGFAIGVAIATVLAAVATFGVLPKLQGFVALAVVIGLVMIPAAMLSAGTWYPAVFGAVTLVFLPLLAPSNPQTFDVAGFYNNALGIFVGVLFGTLGVSLMPPLPVDLRARRLQSRTLRDLRRLTTGRSRMTIRAWEGRVYGRLSAMPQRADLIYSARLTATLAVGTEIIRLRRMAGRLNDRTELDAALAAIARADGAAAVAHLRRFHAQLAAPPGSAEEQCRIRGAVLAIAEALEQHAAFFSLEPGRP